FQQFAHLGQTTGEVLFANADAQVMLVAIAEPQLRRGFTRRLAEQQQLAAFRGCEGDHAARPQCRTPHVGHQQQCLAHRQGHLLWKRLRLGSGSRQCADRQHPCPQQEPDHEASAARAVVTLSTRRAGTCSPCPPTSSSTCETCRRGTGARSNSLLLRTTTGTGLVSAGLRNNTERSPACCASSTFGASSTRTLRVTVEKLR